MISFPRAVINVPDLVEQKERVLHHNKTYGDHWSYPNKADWHGRECEVLGVWDGYAAVRLPEHGRYEYDLLPPEAVTSRS